jgi:hypothetical protein
MNLMLSTPNENKKMYRIVRSQKFLCYVDFSSKLFKFYVQGGARNDSVFDLVNKIFISITVLETNIQKESPLHGDLSSVNQVFSMSTITFGKLLNTNCDVVDYSTAHLLSYLVAGLNG